MTKPTPVSVAQRTKEFDTVDRYMLPIQILQRNRICQLTTDQGEMRRDISFSCPIDFWGELLCETQLSGSHKTENSGNTCTDKVASILKQPGIYAQIVILLSNVNPYNGYFVSTMATDGSMLQHQGVNNYCSQYAAVYL